ncbi:UNVERIFIED_CONTAM: hypothetical protein PYX00_011212 [Menopon gallinae]|uniref:DNA-directed DNA polymerase n=1 Tax=Menopon gallinae TaxID=328185 RepID=A0AAW2H6U0_9NEOP
MASFFQLSYELDCSYVESVNKELEALTKLESMVKLMNETAIDMEIISINTLTVAVRAGKVGGAFSYITNEIKKLTQGMNTQADFLKNRMKLVNNSLDVCEENFMVILNQEKEIADLLKTRLPESIAKELEKTKVLYARYIYLQKQFVKTSAHVNSMMEYLQFQDTIAQSLENMSNVLERYVMQKEPYTYVSKEKYLDYLLLKERLYKTSQSIMSDLKLRCKENLDSFKCVARDVHSFIKAIAKDKADIDQSLIHQGIFSESLQLAKDYSSFLDGSLQLKTDFAKDARSELERALQENHLTTWEFSSSDYTETINHFKIYSYKMAMKENLGKEVIEDAVEEDAVRKSVAYILRQNGFETDEASDGQAGVEKARSTSYDLIITDINMPNKDGFGLMREVRALPEYRFKPILVLTTESELSKINQGKEVGATDGAAKIPHLVARAKELNMKHLALTDHGVMFGVLPFYQEAKKQGINPIIGLEAYISSTSRCERKADKLGKKYYHLTLLAKNWQGYKNLMYLCSQGFLDGFYSRPRIDEELLFKYSEGLICLSGCLASLSSSLIVKGFIDEAKEVIKRYKKAFGSNYYLELQDHGLAEQEKINQLLQLWGDELSIPLVATNDSHYVLKSQANAQDVLICIGTGKRKIEEGRMSLTGVPLYLKSAQEMQEVFPHLPHALSNSVRIAQECQLEIRFPGPLLPHFEVPTGFKDLSDYLRHLAYEGLKKRYTLIQGELIERLNYELEIITTMGFAGYFLIVSDFIRYAREHYIPVGPGRGSGAGSLVAYCLYICDIDPIKYNLLFERFLNPERISMPDFDIDFCYEGRSEVIQYVSKKYGEERVAQIITFGTLKAKAVVKDVARVLDIPFSEANEITKVIAEGPKVSLEQELSSNEDLQKYASQDRYKELFDTALVLEGMYRHTSTHAAGIVIGQEPLVNYVPLYKDHKTGQVSTQFSMEYLEECGLVKMDFLGLKTLTILKNTEELIRIKEPDFSTDNIPDFDEKTFVMLGEGRSKSVFQFESAGMQAVLREAKPTCIEDLIALNALYRPGPMDNIPTFIEGKRNPNKIVYPHPDLKEVLKPTYGVIVYQEQVMQVAQIIAGFSLGRADILRRAMGKKKEAEMKEMEEEFIQGALKKGYEQELAKKIFDILTPFAGYGFNKSHAAAYSVLAYKTAYLKANYAHEFMAANLTNEMNDTQKMSDYLAEAKELGIEVVPPSINASEVFFTVRDNKIVYGLSAVKNIGTGIIEEVLSERAKRGIYAGIFDEFGTNRATMLDNLEDLLEFVNSAKKDKRLGQVSLFAEGLTQLIPFEMKEKAELERKILLEKEKELLGFYVSGHPLEEYRAYHKTYSNLSLKTPKEELKLNHSYSLVGQLSGLRFVHTKSGAKMAFGRLTSFEGEVEVCFFQSTFGEYEKYIQEDKAVLLRAKLDRNSNEIKLIAESLDWAKTNQEAHSVYLGEELADKPQHIQELHIYLKEGSLWQDQSVETLQKFLKHLRSTVKDKKLGHTKLYLHVNSAGKKKMSFRLEPINLMLSEEAKLDVLRENQAVEELRTKLRESL